MSRVGIPLLPFHSFLLSFFSYSIKIMKERELEREERGPAQPATRASSSHLPPVAYRPIQPPAFLGQTPAPALTLTLAPSPENIYFLYLAPNESRPVCTLRRYNPETTSVNECLRCLGCSCLHRVQIVTRFLVANSWDTRNPGSPHHLQHVPNIRTLASFAPVSP